jgi:drug/metabolite transporter, DME family
MDEVATRPDEYTCRGPNGERMQKLRQGWKVSREPERAGPNRGELGGLALVAIAAILWGLLGPIARIALREGVAPLELGFWRAAIGGSLCLGLALARRSAPPERRDVAGVIGFGVVCVALFYASYFFAVETGGAALAAILLYTAPAWVAIGAYLWLGERLSAGRMGAIALTLAGVAAVSASGGDLAARSLAGIGWGLVAGLSYALYYLVGRRYFRRYGALTVLAVALPVGALVLLPLVEFSQKSTAAWLTILFIAAVPTFAAYLIYGAGVVRASPTRAATTAAIEPLVAAVVAFAMWGERLTLAGYVGGALILTGVLLATRGGNGAARTG